MMRKALSNSLFFYQGDHFIFLKQGDVIRTIFRTHDLALAERQIAGSAATGLLTTDDKGSVLSVQETDEKEPHTYSAYGHAPGSPSLRTLLGYNGEATISVRDSYALGNGYRSFNTVLMRFESPDSLSPFGKGGINPYSYCDCDPINNTDPSGHLTFRRWRAPTTQQWRPIRQRELAGPLEGAAEAARHRQRVRAMENVINSVLRDEFRQHQRDHMPGRGNLHMPSHPSMANPNPERQAAIAATSSSHGNFAAQNALTELPYTPPLNSRTNERGSLSRQVSSTSSVDSWDEWNPNPEVVEHHRNLAIMNAIRQARHGP